MTKIIAVAIFILFTCICQAQSFTANIKDLAFMKGRWLVNHEWGNMEEYWGEPIGNCMISSYRCVKEGKIVFYEFVVIEQTDSVPVMILRHFDAHSMGWEDKEHPNVYPLINLGKNRAVFKNDAGTINLIYTLVDQDKLDVVLEEKNKDGKLETTSFHYSRGKE